MSQVGIVTDTMSCLPAELIKGYDIRVVPMGLVINGKQYRDMVDMTPAKFWEMFEQIKEFSTCAVSMVDFAQAFKDLAKTTDNILCIAVSKGLSAVYESALQARDIVKSEQPGLNIEVIDCKTAAGAQGFLVLEAARAAKAGKSLAQIVEVTQEFMPRVKLLMTFDTLKYIIRSGRAPKIAVLGELLQVKPILGLVNNSGVVENVCRARTKPKALLKMIDLVPNYADTSQPMHFIIHYTNRREDAEGLKKLVTSRFKCAEVYLSSYTPVMAGCTGPIVAISFYS